MTDQRILAAAQRLLELEEAADSFLGFVRAVRPNFKLSNFQLELIETLDALERQSLGCRNLLITMPPRHGKQISHTTPVLTTKGWTTHGELVPGDFVFHPFGEPTQVIAISEESPQDCTVHFYDGSEIQCHENHEWTVYDRSRARWVTVETKYIESRARSSRATFQLPPIKTLVTSGCTPAIDAYTLGVWLGDGKSSSASFCGTPEDVSRISSLIPYKLGARWVHKDTGVIYQHIQGDLIKLLKSFNLINNKHIPPGFFIAPEQVRRALLAGLVDTDGSVEPRTQRVRFRSGSQSLCRDVAALVRTLGYRASIDYTSPDQRDRAIKGGASWCVQWTPHDGQGGGTLPRKTVTRTRVKRAIGIEKVTRTKSTMGRCIQVSSPDGLYLVGESLTPTHNSWLASTMFPSYYMCRKSLRKILAVSYGSDLAKKFGREVRDMCQEPVIEQVFPEFQMSDTSSAADDWMTTDGGLYYACGLGGGTTGRPANLLLVDDPIKSRIDAESPSNRNKVWNYYNGSLVNRKEPEFDGTPPIEILVQTRWHPDDLAGRIMDSPDWADGDWHHINFQAITKVRNSAKVSRDLLPADDPLFIPGPDLPKVPPAEREASPETEQALWPERFDLEYLHKMERRSPRDFAALYQQQPYVAGGNLIKSQWFRPYTKDTLPEQFASLIITVDTAFTTKAISDYSVMMVMALGHDGNMYILDIYREKLDYPALKRKLTIINSIWRSKGLRGIYVEAAQAGTMLFQELRSTPGLSIIPYNIHSNPGKNDKVTRANTVLPIIEGGRVYIPDDAPWLDDFLEETQAFGAKPKHDDQVDAMVMGLDILSRVTIAADTWDHSFNLGKSLNQLSGTNAAAVDAMFSTGPRDKDIRQPSSGWGFGSKPLGEL